MYFRINLMRTRTDLMRDHIHARRREEPGRHSRIRATEPDHQRGDEERPQDGQPDERQQDEQEGSPYLSHHPV
jgi:hypothetical protein